MSRRQLGNEEEGEVESVEDETVELQPQNEIDPKIQKSINSKVKRWIPRMMNSIDLLTVFIIAAALIAAGGIILAGLLYPRVKTLESKSPVNSTSSSVTPGPPGPPGTNGTNGTPGTNGLNGTNGSPGVNGVNGTNGVPGVNGLNGTNGTPGINGLNGTDGPPGPPGPPGTNGTDGTPGLDGLNGTDGTPGVNGLNGLNGTDGTPGVNGINGTANFSTYHIVNSTCGGIWTPPRDCNLYIEKNGDLCIISIDPLNTQPINASTFILVSPNLDPQYYPIFRVFNPIQVIDGGTSNVWGTFNIRETGQIRIYSEGQSAFNTSGSAGIFSTTVAYLCVT